MELFEIFDNAQRTKRLMIKEALSTEGVPKTVKRIVVNIKYKKQYRVL